MIKISIKPNNISITGHSGYDDIGKDIVCASVSSIAITTVNAIIRIDESAIMYRQDEGLLEIKIYRHTKTIDILLENMIDLLKKLEIQYYKYIKINKEV